MLKNIETAKEADIKVIIQKKERMSRLMTEAESSNKAAITAKDEARRKEKDLEAEIVQWMKRRDAREDAIIAEKALEREEKEKEI